MIWLSILGGTIAFIAILLALPRKVRKPAFDITVVLFVAGLIVSKGMNRGADKQVLSAFAERVDLQPLENIAVQQQGRLMSLDSHCRSTTRFISGPRRINGQTATFSYFDLMLRPMAYADADMIYVKNKSVRQRIAQALVSDPAIDRTRIERFMDKGLISPLTIQRPEAMSELTKMLDDVIRTAKDVNAIDGAMRTSNPRNLAAMLRIVPPAGDDTMGTWFSTEELWSGSGAPADSTHAGLPVGPRMVNGLDPQLQQSLFDTWSQLSLAWREHSEASAGRASEAIAKLAGLLPQLNPKLYPDPDKLDWESWYYRYHALVWTWMVYLLAIVPLLMAVIYHWSGARTAGILIFAIAFGLHTFSIGLRWYLAERIPNANMYEAIMAATWFGGLFALMLEVVLRKTPMRNLFALGAAVCSMVAMMCSHFLPVTLDRTISHMMPVLNDLWLYIHTNVIIFSYCLIGMAAVTAVLYLRNRLGGSGQEYAKVGGAGELILAGAQNPFVKKQKATAGMVLDGATMVLMELSFVLLWAGLVMGAIWADHSWGRPWGWDPKEVFALNTFIIFLILVHVRLKVKDKGLWTAILACVGCAVMIFNWVVINFYVSGLHAYA